MFGVHCSIPRAARQAVGPECPAGETISAAPCRERCRRNSRSAPRSPAACEETHDVRKHTTFANIRRSQLNNVTKNRSLKPPIERPPPTTTTQKRRRRSDEST